MHDPDSAAVITDAHRKLVELQATHGSVCETCRAGDDCVIRNAYPQMVAAAAVLAETASIIEGTG